MQDDIIILKFSNPWPLASVRGIPSQIYMMKLFRKKVTVDMSHKDIKQWSYCSWVWLQETAYTGYSAHFCC